MAADYLPDVTARMVRSVNRALPTATITESHATLATYGGARGSRERVVIPNPFERTRPIQPAPDGPLMVGIVGRLAPWKGQHVVLDAFARAFPVGPQRCVIIGAALFGEDAYASDLAGQAERLGIADRVDFRGFQDDVEAEIDRLHVLVHASVVPEPFGQVIVEGLAAGRVVVASAAGGPRETITPDKDGLLYPPGDDVALADLLVRLDGDPDLCERLSRAALDRAADFTPALIGSAVMDLYQRILDGRRR
jgi:glycosyltransferase involved in cell wall biosynthesis